MKSVVRKLRSGLESSFAMIQTIAKKLPSSFLIPHSLFLLQYSKQLHINSQAGGLKVSSLAGRERGQKRWRKNSFIIQLPHSLFLVQYSKQLHVNSQAGGLMLCSLAGREREHKRWRTQTKSISAANLD